MRTEIDRNGKKMIMVYDGAAGVLRMLDEQARTYTEMTKADIERLSAQTSGAMAQVKPQMENMFRAGSAQPNGFVGLPVRMVAFKDGAPQTTTEMTEASRQTFPDSLFAVPAGYRTREMPGMRGSQQ